MILISSNAATHHQQKNTAYKPHTCRDTEGKLSTKAHNKNAHKRRPQSFSNVICERKYCHCTAACIWRIYVEHHSLDVGARNAIEDTTQDRDRHQRVEFERKIQQQLYTREKEEKTEKGNAREGKGSEEREQAGSIQPLNGYIVNSHKQGRQTGRQKRRHIPARDRLTRSDNCP